VGIILLELWTGENFFNCLTKEELYIALCQKLSPPPKLNFACGKFSEYFEQISSKSSIKQLSFNITDHVKKIGRLLSKCSSHTPSEFIHFISWMLHPDPNERLTANEAIQVLYYYYYYYYYYYVVVVVVVVVLVKN
jgi:serine/threonine protein kinase